MATRYTQPRKFNPVSLIVLIVVGALIYGAVQFGPPYYRKFKVQEDLTEAAATMYPKRMLAGQDEIDFLSQVEQTYTTKIRDLGVTDPSLRVTARKSSTEIYVEAHYIEVIQHPVVSKTTRLRFNPFATLKIQND